MSLTDLQRAVAYGESELGEVAKLNEAAQTDTIVNARSGATVLAAGQTLATVKSRVAVIHPSVNKIVTSGPPHAVQKPASPSRRFVVPI